jgi:hypothetical protein
MKTLSELRRLVDEARGDKDAFHFAMIDLRRGKVWWEHIEPAIKKFETLNDGCDTGEIFDTIGEALELLVSFNSDDYEISENEDTPPGLKNAFQEPYCHPIREEGKRRAIEEAKKNAKHMGIPFIYRHKEGLWGSVIDGIVHYSGFIQVYEQVIEADK